MQICTIVYEIGLKQASPARIQPQLFQLTFLELKIKIQNQNFIKKTKIDLGVVRDDTR